MNIELLELWREFEAQTTISQIYELYDAVLNTPSGDVVEIGSARGGTTIVLIEAAKQVGKFVYSVDPYPEEMEGKAYGYTPGLMNEFKERFTKNILNGKHLNIIQFNNDLAGCIDLIPDNLSVVFIDGCHEFSFVQKEYELIWPKIVKGGILYIHDIYWGDGQVSKTARGGLTGVAEWLGRGVDVGNMLRIEK